MRLDALNHSFIHSVTQPHLSLIMNKPKTVFMFSGQGSQYFQMGQQLFGEKAIFRNSMQEMDQLVRQSAGYSVLDSLYQPGRSKGDPFDQIHLSYPAIFMVEYALAKVLIEAGLQPELTMGAIMGSMTKHLSH